MGDTIADGLAGNLEADSITPGMVAAVPIVPVHDGEIGAAMRWLFTHHGLVAEGAGAAGLAAVLSDKIEPIGQLVVVISGRNVTADSYAAILQSS